MLLFVSGSLPFKDPKATFLLEAFIQSWFYTCDNTVPAGAGVRGYFYKVTIDLLPFHPVVHYGCRSRWVLGVWVRDGLEVLRLLTWGWGLDLAVVFRGWLVYAQEGVGVPGVPLSKSCLAVWTSCHPALLV